MLFRRRRTREPAPLTDPEIDASIHWLGSRGLVVRDAVSREEWIAATEDPTDPLSLAAARIDGAPCVEVQPAVTLSAADLVEGIDALADGLGLPIDEVEVGDDILRVRSGATELTFSRDGRDTGDVLLEVVEAFTDAVHVALRSGLSFAIVHRDVAPQAEALFR